MDLSVELEAFFVGEEHRHAGAVFAVVENLFGFVIVGMESGNLRSAIDFGLFGRNIVAEDGGGIVWRREGKENEIIFFVSLQFGNAAGAGQFHFVFELAVETVDVQMTGDILEVGDEELASCDFDALDDSGFSGSAPTRRGRLDSKRRYGSSAR